MTSTEAVRFCGRCQSWLPDVIELHVCVRAERAVGYAWYEHDEPAIEKNSIIQESRPAKPGKLIEERPAEQHDDLRAQLEGEKK